jgi:phosphotriesterase-related protein
MEFENITYSHEHMVIDLTKGKNDPDCYLNVFEDALDELKGLYDRGVRRIVDCSNRGMGVDWETNKKLSAETGIEIINSTGFYKDPFLPEYVPAKSVTELSEIMLDDIQHGAKVIGEIGTSKNEWTENEHKVFEAGVLAQRQTNAVIITHTTLGTLMKEQVRFFEENQVNLRKVIISHVALANDLGSIEEILHAGVNVAFDTIGKIKYLPDEDRIRFMKYLIEHGYEKQLLMSMDFTRKSHLKKNGGPGYAYLIDVFAPELLKAGVQEESLRQIMCRNFTEIMEA